MTEFASAADPRVERQRDLRPRLVILGASNVARGLSTAVAAARARAAGQAPELFIACGRGRSYLAISTFVGRSLPSILDCGLWSDLERSLEEARDAPVCAMLTDLGNDLAYGATVERLLDGVERALDRLHVHRAQTVVTSLPLDSLERLPVAWLDAVRRVMFPRSPVRVAELLARAVEFDERLAALCRLRSLDYCAQPASWFGVDPIHHRRAARDEIWHLLTTRWRPCAVSAAKSRVTSLPSPLSLRDRLRCRSVVPRSVRLLGRRVRSLPNSTALSDGSTLRLY